MIKISEWSARAADFFFARRRLESLVLCRVVFGLCLFAHYTTIAVAGRVQAIFGPDGVLGARLYAHVPGAELLARPEVAHLQILNQVSSAGLLSVLYALLIISAVTFALGLSTRVSGVVLLLLHAAFHAQNEFAFWGWGELIKPFLLYVTLSPAGRWYSFDAWLKHRKWKTGPCVGPAWPLRLMQLHVTTVYLVVAWVRIDDPNWRDGSMLYGILSDPMFSRIVSDWRAWRIPMRWACYGAWYVELSAPLFLWLRSTRRTWMWLLIGLHVGLELLTKVGYWDFLLIAALTTFSFE